MVTCGDLCKLIHTIFHLVTNAILDTILGWYWGPYKNCSKPASKEQESIVVKSAVELAAAIRERKLKSYDVVKAYIDRIKSLNPELNAVVDGPFEEEALAEAKSVDAKIANHSITDIELNDKPFLGVPFTTKDSTAVRGKLYTLGLISRKNELAEEDAKIVELLKKAGGIIIATSNVPEVNKWIETRNLLFGQTNNPYDLRRSAGGSSGGEAALIASGASAFGLGTDIGGSIRIPSFNCGIFGHKPTINVVNMRGCTFRSGKEKQTMVVAGPMTRYSKDLMPIFKVMAGPEKTNELKLNETVDLQKLRYFYVPCINMAACNPINDELKETMEKVIKHFKKLTGSDVKIAELPCMEKTSKMWRYWTTQEETKFDKLLGNGEQLNPIMELIKKIFGLSNFSMAGIYSLIDGGILPKENEQVMREATRKCKEALNEILGDDGVLFFHSSPRTAPFHYYPLFKFFDFSYFSLFNVLHVPATQVPMGLDANRLPLGIQVVATENNDRLCLAVAEELEKAFGGWVPPYATRN